MPTYSYDHIHLRSLDPMATAQYFNQDVRRPYRRVHSVRRAATNRPGPQRLDHLHSQGRSRTPPPVRWTLIWAWTISDCGWTTSPKPRPTSKSKGAEFSTEPRDLRPGVKIAFVRAPGDVRIELLERS